MVYLILIAFSKGDPKGPWCLLKAQEFNWEKHYNIVYSAAKSCNKLKTTGLSFEPNSPFNVGEIENWKNVLRKERKTQEREGHQSSEVTTLFICTNKIDNKKVSRKLFKLKEGTNEVWVCACGPTRKGQQNQGWENLVEHIERAYQEQLDVLKKNSTMASSSTQLFWWSKAMQVNAWLDMVVEGLKQISFVEQNATDLH